MIQKVKQWKFNNEQYYPTRANDDEFVEVRRLNDDELFWLGQIVKLVTNSPNYYTIYTFWGNMKDVTLAHQNSLGAFEYYTVDINLLQIISDDTKS